MVEALDVMTRAWTATPLDHKGKYFACACRSCARCPCSVRIRRSGTTSFRRPPSGRAEKAAPILTVRPPVAQVAPDRTGPGRVCIGREASGLDGASQRRLLRQAAIWRWVYVSE
jgi:hypothetical protein